MKDFREVYECDSITLNVTNSCNLNCVYCFEHDKNSQMMSPTVAIDIVDKAYREVPSEIGSFTINIFGGEPLLNWDTIKALIDHCNEKKYKVKFGITTNLTKLTEEMMEYIDDNSIMLLVSIDGIKKIHDKNRCGSYDIVKGNLHSLIDRGLGIFVEARMTILPSDCPYVIDGIRELVFMGVNNICPMPVTDVEWDEGDIEELELCYRDILDFYISILNDETMTRNISIKNTDEILMNVLSPEIDDPLICPIYSNRWCAFDTNGDIYPCHQGPTSKEPFKSEMLIGNIYTGVDVSKIRSEEVHATYPKDRCEDCEGRSVCKCGCPTENLRETGQSDMPSDGYCDTQIALVRSVKKAQGRILSASNIRNRMVNLLKENLKLKEYVDLIYEGTDMEDLFTMQTRVSHLIEMMNNLGEEKIYPTFAEYINKRIAVMVAYQLDRSGLSLEDAEKKLLKEEPNG